MVTNTSNKSKKVEVLIFGAGIAGCAAAKALSERATTVILVDNGGVASGMESLSPQACREIPEEILRQSSSLHEFIAWWGSDSPACRRLSGARIMRRDVLAQEFRSYISDIGCQILRIETLLELRGVKGIWTAMVQTCDGSIIEIQAQRLVDATGRTAAVAKLLGSRRILADRLSCVSAEILTDGISGVWTEAVPNGWWNFCSNGHQGTLSFYSVGSQVQRVKRNFKKAFQDTQHLRRITMPASEGSCCVRVSGSSLLSPCAGQGWVAIGDAAATLQPLASSGTTLALRDGKNIAFALQEVPRDFSVAREKEFNGYLRELSNQYRIEKRWPESTFWRRWTQ
jgi:flavin-dependent dehydrogenase